MGRLALLGGALLLSMLPAGSALSQTPGLPVLQGVFVSPGRAVAVNAGHGDRFSTVALATAWTPLSGSYQLSAGAGVVDTDGEGGRATGVGVRVARPIRTRWTGPDSPIGAVLHVGVGGAWKGTGGELRVPVGATVGYRRRLGSARALSVYAGPYFQWSRFTGSADAGADVAMDEPPGEEVSDSDLIRAAVGVDLLLTTRMALSLGYDFGAAAAATEPGPGGGIVGAGVSWRF